MHNSSRRVFVDFVFRGLGASLVLTAIAGLRAQTSHAQSRPSQDPPSISMEEWMEASKKVPPTKEIAGALQLGRFKDPIYILLKSISWRPPRTGPYRQLAPVSVPEGFVTDLASIPQLFWSLIKPDGDYAYAAIVHDYLYWIQDRKRSEADQVFRSAMENLRVKDVVADPIFRMVDLFGGKAWERNAQLRAAGEQRILARYPEDPRITWEEWKQQANVFRT